MRSGAGVRLRMIRGNWEGLPVSGLLPSYSLRPFEAGDQVAWLEIHRKADIFNRFPSGRFETEFGHDPAVLKERQFYLLSPDGKPVGTATAWWDATFREGDWGMVHWLAIVPEEQGKGLAKPLLTSVCLRLQELGHRRACLRTASGRFPAIKLYWQFGFRPCSASEQEKAEWEKLLPRLRA